MKLRIAAGAVAALIVAAAAAGCASTNGYHFDPNAPKLPGDSLGFLAPNTELA